MKLENELAKKKEEKEKSYVSKVKKPKNMKKGAKTGYKSVDPSKREGGEPKFVTEMR